MIANDPLQPRRPVWVPVLLALVTIAVYSPLVSAEFSYFDDNFNLFENPRMNPPTWETIGYYWTHSEHGLYIPLTYTIWAVLAAIGRVSPDPMGIALNPWLFHAANIGVHTLTVLAVYGLLVRLFSSRLAAGIGALLFAIHPVQVEPVAWVAGMKDVLAGMLGITSVWLYTLWVREKSKSIHDSYFVAEPRGIYALAMMTFIFALLAKPSAVAVPAIAGIIDVGLIGRNVRQALKALWPWMVVSIAFAIVGKLAQPAIGVPEAPLWARPLIMLDALAFYLYKLVFPFWLGVDYGRKPSHVMSQWWFWLTWVLPAALALLLYINRRRWRELLVAGLVFVAGVGPVLGLVTFLYQYRSTTADHYIYLAMLGPAIAAAWLITKYPRPAILAGAGVVLLLLGTMTILQTRVWADDLKLFEHALRVNPRSVMALHNLAHAHAIRGRPQQAVPLLEQAIAGDPTYMESYEYLAAILKGTGRLDEAIGYRLRALDLVEARPPALQQHLTAHYVSVGRDLYDAGRYAEAKAMFERALKRDPADPDALGNLKIVDAKLDPPPG